MRIAVDFDGTIVEHRYPAIGEERPMAIMTLQKLQEEGNQLILWSVREGQLLQDAVDWCRERGIEFYAVNANYPGEKPTDEEYARKITVDMVIDDRNFGGLPHWSTIYQVIHHRTTLERYLRHELRKALAEQEPPKKKHWWQR